jgi:general secretion pathway protein H
VKLKGFTLLELLVVLIIIGLFSSLVLFNVVADDNQRLEREGSRLIRVIELTQDEAIMHGVEFGLVVDSTQYSFLTLENETWLPISANPYLAKHALSEPLSLTVEVENNRVVQELDGQLIPQILILSSGELTAFKLILMNADQPDYQVHIIGQENGQVSMQKLNV